MKTLLIILTSLYISICGKIHAQQFYETIALVTDKDNYHPSDTLYTSGVLVSPETMQPSRISHYCTLELLNAKGEVVARQKVKCKDAVFHARIPLHELVLSDFLILRAYTQFMLNFNDTFWPMVAVGINQPTKSPVIQKINSPKPDILQLSYLKKHLAYKYLALDSLHTSGILSIYTQGKKVAETEIQNQETGYFKVPDNLAGSIAYGLVTDKTNNIIFTGGSIALADQVSPEPFILQVNKDSVKTGRPINITLHGGSETLCLIMRMEKTENESWHPIKQCVNRFIDMNASTCDSLLRAQYSYTFAPEQVLSLKGTVKTEMGNTFKQGSTIMAFDNTTGYTYESDIAEDGTFKMGVDDFKDGTSFFLQAYNRKGKSNNYNILFPDNIRPGIHFPIVKWKERNATQADFAIDTTDSGKAFWIPEVTIKAVVHKDDTASNRFYKKNYMELEDIEKYGTPSLEFILRKMPGIRLQKETEGNGTYIFSTRGATSLSSGDDAKETRIGINIDGVWVEDGDKAIDLETVIDPANIQSIEYIPAISAFAQYGVKAFNGVIAIKTRSGKNVHHVQSQGVRYQPEGLWDNRTFSSNIPLRSICLRTNEKQEIEWKAPLYAGNYRIVVEAVSSGNKVIYRKKGLTVLPE